MSRMVRDGKTGSYEYLRIVEHDGGLNYVAKPSQNKDETIFRLSRTGKGEVIFENPDHDFPQRIIYRQPDANTLNARIEGMRNGELRGMDIPMKRTKCE
jgi:hypothetical protein